MSDEHTEEVTEAKGSERLGRFQDLAEKATKSAQSAAGVVVEGSKAAGGQIVRVTSSATEQASRAAAIGAAVVVSRMPTHAPGEPVRAAILDTTSVNADSLAVGTGGLQPVALLSAQFLLADFVTSREQDEMRWQRMERVVARQRLALHELGFDQDSATEALIGYGRCLESVDRIAFLVDLYFLDPFAPYALKSGKLVRRRALERIAALVGGDDEIVRQIGETRRSALGAHTKQSLGKIGLIGIGAAVALGVAGFLAAPLLGAAIGTAAGLSGAAAVSHGLAILGGGALAAGGAGMAGGLWLVAGAGAAAGLLAAGGGTALYQLGSATARGELVKLQITFKLGILDANTDMAKAQQVIANLVAQADATRVVLEEERKLNDENADRVKDLESTLTDIEEAIGWMIREQELAADSA